MKRELYGHEGFSDIIIPATTIRSCIGCKYHKHELYKSGRHPEYIDYCINPNTELRMGKRYIDTIEEYGVIPTPEWCPFLNQE